MPKIIVRNFSFGLFLVFLLVGCGSPIGSGEEEGGEEAVTATVEITASPINVEYGGATELSWSASNVETCLASNDWSGERSVSGSMTLSNLQNDQVFTITCDSESGVVSDTVAVSVNDQQSGGDPELTFWSSSSQITLNSPVNLYWNSSNLESCTASGDWSGSKALSGSELISAVASNSEFILQCEGPAGPVTESLFVTIVDTPVDPPVVNFSASALTVDYDGETTLQWTTTDADSCVASGGWSGSKAVSGNETIQNLRASTTFTLNCSGPGGLANETVSVVVNDPPLPELTFNTSSQSVEYDGSITLVWSSNNTTSCTASGDWSGTKAVSGTEAISNLQSDSEFSLSCTGAGGAVFDTITVSVADPVSEPQLSLTASQLTVDYDGSTTLQWNATNADSCSASGDWTGVKSTSGSEVISNLQEDSEFGLSCTGTGGTVSLSVNVTVNITTSGTALLSWSPPAENTDGSTLEDLMGYRIYYGNSSGSYSESITINSTGITSYLVENLSSGQWYFVMTAVNSSNVESGYSNEASKTIN